MAAEFPPALDHHAGGKQPRKPTCVAGTACYRRTNRDALVAGGRNKAEGNIAHSFDLYGWGAEGVRT
jgi:hypothetical protein